MNKRIFSTNLYRILVIAALVIPLSLGTISPVTASSLNIIGWGSNQYNQLNFPSGLTDVVAIAAGGWHNIALKSDGTVVGWGNQLGSDVPTDLMDVIAIDGGAYHNLALKGDGTVVAWGLSGDSSLNVPSDLTDAVAIAAGGAHSLALKSDGTVVGWGQNGFGQISMPSDLTDVVAISAGHLHSLALKSDGTVFGWGANNCGQINIPSGLTNVVAIDAGECHGLALKSNGTVVAWGNNYFGQATPPSDLADVVAIAAGRQHNLALKSDGTIVAWGRNDYGQASIPPGLTGVVAITAGMDHSLALVPAGVPSNTAPSANPGGPYLGAVNTAISFDGSASSDPENDPLNYAWDFGDNSSGLGVMPTHSYANVGIYTICLTVDDGELYSDPACTLAVIYDPSAGFVTGGGWINSPAGAYKADETLAGKATFGFVSKYQKGTNVPTGTTAFQFDLAGLAFSSTSYEWLVVNKAGMNAQFKGTGLINGALDSNGNAYKFMLWASDGSPDTFRIRIWWEDAVGEHDVYDNGVDQTIGAGNIVVHTGK